MVEFRSVSSWVQTPQQQVTQESTVIGRRLAETKGDHSSPGHCFTCRAHVNTGEIEQWGEGLILGSFFTMADEERMRET